MDFGKLDGAGVKVAVIDSGIRTNHPALPAPAGGICVGRRERFDEEGTARPGGMPAYHHAVPGDMPANPGAGAHGDRVAPSPAPADARAEDRQQREGSGVGERGSPPGRSGEPGGQQSGNGQRPERGQASGQLDQASGARGQGLGECCPASGQRGQAFHQSGRGARETPADSATERSAEYADLVGHGTACAGIIHAKAPAARLFAVRVLGEDLQTDEALLIRAVDWAVDHGMDVANLSLGTTSTRGSELEAACRRACEAGMILVAAWHNKDARAFPAAFETVISVGSTRGCGRYGYRRTGKRNPELLARGDGQRLCWVNPDYVMLGGTSFAAPHVTGVVALIRQMHRGASLERVRELLHAHATPEPAVTPARNHRQRLCLANRKSVSPRMREANGAACRPEQAGQLAQPTCDNQQATAGCHAAGTTKSSLGGSAGCASPVPADGEQACGPWARDDGAAIDSGQTSAASAAPGDGEPACTGSACRRLSAAPGNRGPACTGSEQRQTCRSPAASSRTAGFAWLGRVALYPYNKEMHALIRGRDLLPFAVTAVADPAGKGLVGRDAGEVIGAGTAGLRIQVSLDKALEEAETLVLGYVDRLARAARQDVLKRCVISAVSRGKHVFSLLPVPAEQYGDLHQLAAAHGVCIVTPGIGPEEVARTLASERREGECSVPVLGVFGTSSQQGKFTLQLILRRRLLEMGYRVAQIGTEHHSELFGMDLAFPMGYACTVAMPVQLYEPFLQTWIQRLCREREPDILIVGGQSGTVPYDVQRSDTHTLATLAFVLATRPDACILVVNASDPEPYVQDTIDGLRAVARTPVLMLAMADQDRALHVHLGRRIVRARSMEAAEIRRRLSRLEERFGLPAACITDAAGQVRIERAVIQYFSAGEQEVSA